MIHEKEIKERRFGVARERPIRALAIAGLLILAVLVLAPLFETGFTTRDDAETGLLPDQWGGWWPAVWALTNASGRFFHLASLHLVFALSRLCSSSPTIYHLLAQGSILANVVCFYLVVARVLKSKSAGVLAAACALTWMQNGWNHTLLTSYPVLPHLGLTAFLGVVLLLLGWQRTGRHSLAIFAGATYFVALLVSEAFVVYFPVLLGLCVFRARQEPGSNVASRIRMAAHGGLPAAIGLAVYLVCYFTFRHAYPSHHYGNQLAPFNIGRIATVIWQYACSTFPSYFFFRDPASLNPPFDGAGKFWRLFASIPPESIAKALIAALFCWLVLSRGNRLFTARSFVLAIVTGLACVVAPVFLVGLTRQYQDWVINHGSLAYGAPSYYAYFAMVFVLAVTMLGLRQVLARWRLAGRLYVLLACCFVAATSLATDLYNQSITRDQQLSHLKWKTVERFMRTDSFAAIPPGSTIYAPSLWRPRGIVANSDNYWTEYLSQRSKKRVSVSRSALEFKTALEKNPGLSAYFLGFEQEPREPKQFLVFAALKGPGDVRDDGTAYGSSFALFSYGTSRKFKLSGQGAGDGRLTVEVNAQPPYEFDGNVFSASVDHPLTAGDFPKTTVRASAPVDLTRLVISYFPSEQRPR
ncbi:MAG TPA: hypothetical protein VM940_13830 [Chthoniobacterales bacterium]|jgi:hypothetical protein|nr:hypothetical protein [Chthoniobacterales bacterium]